MKQHDYPALYHATDSAAITAQAKYLRALKWQNGLVVTASILVLIGIDNAFAAGLAAFLFFGTLSISVFIAVRKYESIWYRARATAESVKTMTWRFVMRAEPYEGVGSGVDVEQKFRDRLYEALRETEKLGAFLTESSSAFDQITSEMTRLRSLGLNERKQIYETKRISEQRSWYSSKATQNKRKNDIYFALMIVMQALAGLFSISRIIYPNWHYWPPEVCVVVAGILLSWIQIRRFEEHAVAYTLAAHEIGILASKLPNINGERDFSVFVSDAENAFSREHTQWVARRDI